MDRIITEMQKAGIEPMINFRSDSESLVKIPGTNNYADLWEWWEHNFVKAYFMAKSYGIKEFNLLNEPNFLGKSDMSSIMACYREGADAIRAGAAAALGDDVKVRIWGPGFYGDPTPSKWGDKFVKEMDSQMDVYDYHTYSDKDSENLKRIDAITARLEKYDSDGDIEPISISEWNYQLSAPAMDIYERMDNVMKTSGRFKMFVDNGIYAPFYFNMFRRYNRWGNALVYCTDAAAQSYNCTKMYYAMRILGRAFSNPDGSKLIAETELSGNTDNLEVFAAKTDKEYYVLLMNKDKKTSRTYNIDVSALGTTADKAFLREVSKFRNDDVVEQCSITDGRLTAEALTPQAIHLFVIPIEQEQQAEPTEIYSTRNNENNIEIIWKNQENVLEYKVERRETGDGAFETIAENVPFSFYTDTEAEPGKKYEYRVRSVYINGEAVSETAGPLALTNGGGKIVSPYVSTADEKYNPELFKAVSGNWLRNYCANGEDVLFYTESRAGSENIAVVTPELDNEFNDYTATIGFDLTYAGNGSYFGPVIRYIDEDNYYKLVYDFGSATGKIIKRKDGVETVLASEKAGAPHDEKNVLQSGKQQIMRCTVDGNRIDFSIKCNLCVPQVITAYDPDPIPYGTVGICAANGTKLGWDDIRLEAAFTDTFDGGGKRGEWKENGGKWVAEGGKYKRLDSEGSAFAVAGYDNSTDYYFQTDFDAGNMTGDASVDFYALYKDENNYFKYSVTADDQLVIIKRINGHDTELVRASTDDIPWTEKYRFGLQIEKQEHRVYINNVLAASFTELEPKLTYGSVGIGTTNTTASFDNVSMNAYLWDYNGGDTPYITAEDENGNRVDSLPETGSTTVSAHIPDGYTEEAPSFMAAVYDAQGILKQIIRPEPETKNTESGMTISLVIPEDITGGKVKIMLWDSISSMKPLCNSLLLLKSTSG